MLRSTKKKQAIRKTAVQQAAFIMIMRGEEERKSQLDLPLTERKLQTKTQRVIFVEVVGVLIVHRYEIQAIGVNVNKIYT